jgi:hypothetical protein
VARQMEMVLVFTDWNCLNGKVDNFS